MTSWMEIISYFLDLLRGFLWHWCFGWRVVLPVIKLNLVLLYFIIFVHYDRCGALVCLFYYYFCVSSEFFKCYTFSVRQVISWQWPLRTFLRPELKQKLSVKARLNRSSGKDASGDVFSPCGKKEGRPKPPHVHTLGFDSLYYKHKRVNLVHLLKNTYSNL